MREVYFDISELSDSREIMIQKSPRGIRIFLLIVAGMLAAALAWSYWGKLDTYVKAAGEIRTDSALSTVSLPNGGKLKEICCQDGAQVKKGDVLYVLDGSYYQEQMDAITQQIDEKSQNIIDYETLKSAIAQDVNLFSEAGNPVFYYQYEDYRIELESALQQLEDAEQQIANSAEEYQQGAEQAQNQADSLAEQQAAYRSLYLAIRYDWNFYSSNKVAISTYQNYLNSRDKAQITYDQYAKAYQELLEEEDVSDAELSQAKYAQDVALADLEAVKSNTLANIAISIAELEQQIASYEDTADTYTLKETSLDHRDNQATSREKIKNSYYISISTAIKNLQDEIVSLENQSLDIKEALDKMEVISEQDGTLVQYREYAVGDIIGAGTTLSSVIPENYDYVVMLYIPESKITEVNVGQKVEYTFDAISETDFGKAYGKITSISADSVVDENSGQKFYKATASIGDTVLHGKNGENRTLQIGMLTEVHAITGQQRLIVWLLDKLNFR